MTIDYNKFYYDTSLQVFFPPPSLLLSAPTTPVVVPVVIFSFFLHGCVQRSSAAESIAAIVRDAGACATRLERARGRVKKIWRTEAASRG